MKFKLNDWLDLDELRTVYLQRIDRGFITILQELDIRTKEMKQKDGEYIYNLLLDGIRFRKLKEFRRINEEIKREIDEKLKQENLKEIIVDTPKEK